MVVAAVVAGLLNLVALRSGDDRVAVAVLAAGVAAGQPVAADALRYEPLGVSRSLQASLVTEAAAAAGGDWIAVRDLQAGDLLRRSDLRSSAAPDGQRAMSVPVDPAHAAGGALRAGDRVDVIDVRDDRAAYVLTGAEVLAVTGGGAGGLGGTGGFSITVAVDADAALRLALAIRSESVDVVRSTGATPASAAEPAGTDG
jgi:Flp pilus assembly protein CpaB